MDRCSVMNDSECTYCQPGGCDFRTNDDAETNRTEKQLEGEAKMNYCGFVKVHDMNNVHVAQFFKREEVIAILPASKTDGAMVLCSAIYFQNGSHMMASETPAEVMECIRESMAYDNES